MGLFYYSEYQVKTEFLILFILWNKKVCKTIPAQVPKSSQFHINLRLLILGNNTALLCKYCFPALVSTIISRKPHSERFPVWFFTEINVLLSLAEMVRNLKKKIIKRKKLFFKEQMWKMHANKGIYHPKYCNSWRLPKQTLESSKKQTDY